MTVETIPKRHPRAILESVARLTGKPDWTWVCPYCLRPAEEAFIPLSGTCLSFRCWAVARYASESEAPTPPFSVPPGTLWTRPLRWRWRTRIHRKNPA